MPSQNRGLCVITGKKAIVTESLNPRALNKIQDLEAWNLWANTAETLSRTHSNTIILFPMLSFLRFRIIHIGTHIKHWRAFLIIMRVSFCQYRSFAWNHYHSFHSYYTWHQSHYTLYMLFRLVKSISSCSMNTSAVRSINLKQFQTKP